MKEETVAGHVVEGYACKLGNAEIIYSGSALLCSYHVDIVSQHILISSLACIPPPVVKDKSHMAPQGNLFAPSPV